MAEPGPPPEEVLALQYEYGNMQAWDLAYDLFAEQSEGLVTEVLYTEVNQQTPNQAITQYSFPSVDVQGNNATIERIYTVSVDGELLQDKATQEAVVDGGVWRLLIRDDQAEYYNTFTQEETTG